MEEEGGLVSIDDVLKMEFLVALPPKLIQPFYIDFSLWSCNSVKFTNWVPLLKENPLLTHHLLNRLIKTYSIHDSRSICNANDHIHSTSTYYISILDYSNSFSPFYGFTCQFGMLSPLSSASKLSNYSAGICGWLLSASWCVYWESQCTRMHVKQ